MSTASGVELGYGQAILSVIAALVLVPAQRALRPRIDSVFFPERHAFERGIDDLVHELAEPGGSHGDLAAAVDRIDALLRPRAGALYTCAADGRFVASFSRGSQAFPDLAATSPLIAALRGRRRPLAGPEGGRIAARATDLDPFQRAVLETLRVSVVVPVHRDDHLLGFLCLAAKRSGDVYTAVELALLGLTAQSIARYVSSGGRANAPSDGESRSSSPSFPEAKPSVAEDPSGASRRNRWAFISYASEDAATAARVVSYLESRGIACWFAPRDARPGHDYAVEIIHAIETAEAIVLLLSDHANRSQFVRKEIERAVSKAKYVIPLRLHDVAPAGALELLVSSEQWIDASVPPIERHLDRLADSIVAAGLRRGV